MKSKTNINDIELLNQKITELNTFIEYLILYMMKKNIIDKVDFFKSMQSGFVDDGESNIDSNNTISKRGKLEAFIFKDSLFNFQNEGES